MSFAMSPIGERLRGWYVSSEQSSKFGVEIFVPFLLRSDLMCICGRQEGIVLFFISKYR